MISPTTLCLSLLLATALSIANPAVLLSVPFPLAPPTLTLHLPLPIANIVLSNLELNNVQLREVDYQWKLFSTKAEVNVTRAVVSFDWFFKRDSGKGFFIEDNLDLVFEWNFTMTKQNRLQIDITNTKIHPGTMKVELGGGVPETVTVEVTNLILNKASITFRGIIANKLSSALTDASKVLGQDLQVYHDATHNKNIKINTTLVSAPLISNQTLYIQINAAPYIEGEASGVLNPPEVLVKGNSSKIQLQLHKLIVSRILELVLKIRGQVFVEIESSTITSVIDIDSLSLSPVFPPMAFYPQNRDVIFSVSIPTITFDLSGQDFLVKIRGQCVVSTQGKTDKARSLYMNPVNVSASIELAPIFGPTRNSIRIMQVEVVTFSPDKRDIDAGLIIPEELSQYFPELMDWVHQAANLALNRKVLQLSYENIVVALKGKALNEHSYNLEIDLI